MADRCTTSGPAVDRKTLASSTGAHPYKKPDVNRFTVWWWVLSNGYYPADTIQWIVSHNNFIQIAHDHGHSSALEFHARVDSHSLSGSLSSFKFLHTLLARTDRFVAFDLRKIQEDNKIYSKIHECVLGMPLRRPVALAVVRCTEGCGRMLVSTFAFFRNSSTKIKTEKVRKCSCGSSTRELAGE